MSRRKSVRENEERKVRYCWYHHHDHHHQQRARRLFLASRHAKNEDRDVLSLNEAAAVPRARQQTNRVKQLCSFRSRQFNTSQLLCFTLLVLLLLLSGSAARTLYCPANLSWIVRLDQHSGCLWKRIVVRQPGNIVGHVFEAVVRRHSWSRATLLKAFPELSIIVGA